MTRHSYAGDEQRAEDDLAERRRERDLHREPSGWRRPARDLTRRRALQARVVDSVNVAIDTSITAIECPSCLAPVFVPADSDNERVDCLGCDARLVTARTIDGVTAFELAVGP